MSRTTYDLSPDYNLKKEFLKYTSLNILAMVGFAFYIFVDTFFIALAVGPLGLAALNFSIPGFSLLQGLSLMISVGSATLFSVHKSTIPPKEETSLTHGLVLGLTVASVFFSLGLFFSEELSIILGSSGDALPLTNIYLKVLFIFAPANIVNNLLLAFIRNDGNPKLPMIAIISSSLFNIIGDYVLMFPLNMGMFGAVFATSLSTVVSIAILSTHIFRRNNSFSLVKCKIQVHKLCEILKLGLSSFAGEMATAISVATFNFLVFGIAGNIGVAAYGIITNIAFVLNYLYTGLALGIQPVVSFLFGKRQFRALNKTVTYSLIYALVIASLAYTYLFFFTDLTVGIFNTENNKELGSIAHTGVLIFFVGYFFAGINYVSASILSASLKAKRGMTVAILRCSIVLIPFAIIGATTFGLHGLWFSYIATELVVAVIAVVFLKQLRKENLLENSKKSI